MVILTKCVISIWTDPFLINLNVSVQWYPQVKTTSTSQPSQLLMSLPTLHQPINLANCQCIPLGQWSWKAWTGEDSVHQQKTTLTHWPSHLLMLQKSTPGTWTSRDMVMKDIPYKEHSMLHIGLSHKLWLVPKSPTRGHQIESQLSLTTDNS